MALSLYNEFGFEKSKTWKFVGFNEKYANEENLLCVAAKKTYEYAKKTVIPLQFTLLKSEVPDTRGLGSSATCIVAGVLAANKMMNNYLKKEDLLQIAAGIEGYPDNVTPALYGGLTASYVSEKVKTIKYNVNDKLKFLVCIPPFEMSTFESRKGLPKQLSYEDIIFNTSRLVNLPYAFLTGDISLIREILSDKMHEPYRLPLIEGAAFVKKVAQDKNLPVFLSGSGSTMIIIYSGSEHFEELKGLRWQIKTLKIDSVGARYEE